MEEKTKTIHFYPLDIKEKFLVDRSVIYLFGKTHDDQKLCVMDKSYLPYFYVVTKKDEDLSAKIKKIRLEDDNGSYFVTRTESHGLEYHGKKRDVIKVFVNRIRAVRKIAAVLHIWDSVESVNEHDISFAKKYLIDKGIELSTLLEVNGEFVNSTLNIPCFDAFVISQFSEESIESPKSLSFHAELSDDESPSLLSLSFYSDDLDIVYAWKNNPDAEPVKGEVELIEKFVEVVDEQKPDILVGYDSDYHLSLIARKAEKYRIRTAISADSSLISVITKRETTSKITGLLHIDLLKFISKIIKRNPDKDSLSLENISKEFLLENNLNTASSIAAISDKFIPMIFELAKQTSLEIFDVSRASYSKIVESYLMKSASKAAILIPPKPGIEDLRKRRQLSYTGAFVYEPVPGIYDDIAVYDFNSLYPSIIVSFNISPNTLNCECCKESARNILIEGKEYWFCERSKDFIPSVLEDLITRRRRIKEILSKKEKKDIFLSAREKTLKLIANSFYGYMGYFGSRWYSIESANATTALARDYIKNTIKKAGSHGFTVIYGDTDSVFLSIKNKTEKDMSRFLDDVNLDLPPLMELELDGFYKKGIFVSTRESSYGAKKKYALLNEKGSIKIKGFESVKRNWSSIAKETQQKVISIILKEESPEKAISYVREMISKLKNKEADIDSLAINTILNKNVDEYEIISPHVAVAKKMISNGKEVKAGTLIRYIVTEGDDKISDRSYPAEEVTRDSYDADYYINNQIIPSVESIFELVDVKKDQLLEEKEQSDLDEFI